MLTRRFALITGIIYLAVGILGFIPPLLSGTVSSAPDLQVTTLSGNLLGLFPVNILHSIVHLLIGVWGIAASRSWDGARTFARGLAILYALLVLLAFISPSTFGLIPIGSHDIWLHAVTALAAAYFGWMRPVEAGEREAVMR